MDRNHVEAEYQLTPLQQGMLFHHRLNPRSGIDLEQMVCSLPEEIDIAAFGQAWQTVVMRHQALRSRFVWEGLEEPLQRVDPSAGVPFTVWDWQHLPADRQQAELAAYLERDREQGFDLSRAPLLRVALFRMGKADHTAVWTFHHIIADGRSHPIVLSELFMAYEAVRKGASAGLDRPPQYHSFIEWLRMQDPRASEDFWKRQLRGFAAATSVDALCGTARAGGEKGIGEQHADLSPAPASALQLLADREHLTLNAVVHACWALLLARCSGEDDVVFGTVRSCRRNTVADADSIVGLCINTLPFRVRIRTGQNLLEWLKELRDQLQEVRTHEHTPLMRIIEWSSPRKGMPLFESIVIFDTDRLNDRLHRLGENWRSRDFRLIERTGFPLVLYAEAGSLLSLRIAYDRGRFGPAGIARMLGYLTTLLGEIARNADRPVFSVPMLPARETGLLLYDWNATKADYPDRCVHELFEDQATRTPDAVALVFRDRRLTYGELNERAGALAGELRACGVGPETRVGIYLDRSFELLVAVLGILKAGGAYLPLDPVYPADRIRFMLEDAEVPVIVSRTSLAGTLPRNAARVIEVDRERNPVPPAAGGGTPAAPDNLCYVIYTSGSTGKPKGVMVCHSNVANFFAGMDRRIPRFPSDTWLAVTSLSFDISVLELLWTLCRGFTVVLAADGTLAVPEGGPGGNDREPESFSLPDLLRRHSVTHFQCTPTLAAMLLADAGTRTALRSVRTFLVGGEALPAGLARELTGTIPGPVINMYGPTETTIWSTTWPVDGEDGTAPIGRPIINTQIYILDKDLVPVPVGAAGELYIGGAGVARGYLNRPALTAERFIDHPFEQTSGARLYRTGDLARYRPDGTIEYLGRIDSQVKIRGFRIEPGEIEAVLEEHALVRTAAVSAREDVPGDRQLVAYVVPRGDRRPSASELLQHLRDKLPGHMVPAVFVVLERLPLTPNGKIDRKTLPRPAASRPELETGYSPPRTGLERSLTAIWREVLRIKQIGVNDSFFDLGGNSLRLAQVHARLNAAARAVSLLDLFRYPTVRSLACYMSGGEPREDGNGFGRIGKLKEGKSRLLQRSRKRELAVRIERGV